MCLKLLVAFMGIANLVVSGATMFRKQAGMDGYLPVTGFRDRLSARHAIDCSRKCTKDSQCVSFFFVEDTSLCQTHGELVDDQVQHDTVSTAKYEYYIQDCGYVSNIPTGGRVDVSGGTQYLDVATFTCNTGYELKGVETTVCQLDGSWSAPRPNCTITDCGYVSNIPTGGRVDVSGGTQYLDVATFTCNTGYELKGVETTVCQLDGSWSAPRPNCTITATDCYDILHSGVGSSSGVYTVYLLTIDTVLQVFCDMDTDSGGWTVFQYRIDGSVDFYQPYTQFENGFGDYSGEFWLGLKYIHEMTKEKTNELYLNFVDKDDLTAFEKISDFNIAAPDTNYTVSVGVVLQQNDSAATAKSFVYNNGAMFSANDADNDIYYDDCALERHAGWWFTDCTWINPNGEYVTPGTESIYEAGWGGMTNYPWRTVAALKSTKLMFRRA